MKRIRVLPDEEFRVDRFIIRNFGSYQENFFKALLYYNPLIDFVNFLSGVTIKVPNNEEIVAYQTYSGKYSLYK